MKVRLWQMLTWSVLVAAIAGASMSAEWVGISGELEHLALWRDVNTDGRSDPGEVIPLVRYGITALSCRHELVTDDESTVGAYAPDGVRFIDGTTRPTYDLILRVVPASLENAS